MADEATTSDRSTEQATNESQQPSAASASGETAAGARPKRKPAARTRKKVEQVTPDVSDAVAQSLAELKIEAPKRTVKRPTAHIEDADALLEGIQPHDATPEKSTRVRKTKAASATKQGATKQAVPDSSEQESKPKRTRTRKASVSAVTPDADVLFTSNPEPAATTPEPAEVPAMTALLFQEPDVARARTRRRPARTDAAPAPTAKSEVDQPSEATSAESDKASVAEAEDDSAQESSRRKRGSRGRRKISEEVAEQAPEEATENSSAQGEAEAAASTDVSESGSVTRRRRRRRSTESSDEVAAPKGSTRLEAKRQRRKEGREAGRRRHSVTESEYLARRESVKRDMLVREQDGLNQIAVLEDGVLVEHYVARHTQVSMVGNVYLGRVQNVLPSMEAAFVDIGKGRNAVLYAGEVNWEAAGMDGKPRRIEQALKSGDTVLVQVTKDPIGHKGARLTAQITLAGRHLVLVPSGAMTGISRKLPEKERQRLKKLLREIVPPEHGVIVRTAAEGATEEQLRADVDRLTKAWNDIQQKSKNFKSAPSLLKGEPELAVRVVRDIFNEDFQSLVVQGDEAWSTISEYVSELSPELSSRLSHWTSSKDIFAEHRVDEQLAKAFDRKVWLPSGGTLIIDRTEAMTVIDVNTGKFTGAGGTLEETVTRNNLEAAEEIVRQLRLRDIGGIIVVDFIDMVLEANRELVLRRLIECLGRDRTRHQVAEVTSLGLIQMTRKRVGQGLVEAFSTPCEACEGRGFITHTHPVERNDQGVEVPVRRKNKPVKQRETPTEPAVVEEESKHGEAKAAINSIAAAAAKGHGEQADDANHNTGGDGRENLAGDASTDATTESESEDKPVNRRGSSRGAKSRNSNAGTGSTGRQTRGNARRGSNRSSNPATSNAAADNASVSTTAPNGDGEKAAGSAEPARARRTRRVSSSGTITPGAGASGAILSFPAE